jgi:ABC-2 type transport system permease protein
MPSKMSLWNKEISLQIGRNIGWISIIYFLGLLFALPINMLMMYSGDEIFDHMEVNNLFEYHLDIQIGLLVIIPILLAVFLFRFLHVKQAADLMHSLPLKREKIFHHYAVIGMVFLILPIVIISILILFIHSALDLQSFFEAKDVFYWAGITILMNLILFTSGVFIAMMTGISVVHAVLSYIFLLFPVGMTLLLFHNLQIFLYGFPSIYFLNSELEKMSPITYTTILNSRPFHWNDIVIYAVLIVILYGLSLFFYKKRKPESAAEAMAFPALRYIFKYGVTFCTMLMGGMYFNEVQFASLGWTIFGYAFGAIFGYFFAEMVLQKTWRISVRVKGLAIYTVVIVILVIGIQTLGVYENRIPEQSEIKSVLMTNDIYIYKNQNESYDYLFTPTPMKKKESIKHVVNLHEQILKDKKINQRKEKGPKEDVFLVYELENGKKVIRQYNVNKSLYGDLFKPIYESEEYKLNSNEIFNVNEKEVEQISISVNGPISKRVTISEPGDVKEVLGLLREDLLAESYEDSQYFQSGGSSIEFHMDTRDHFMNMEFKPSYLKFTEWLKNKELLDQARVTSDDISHVLVAKGDAFDWYDKEPEIKEIEQSGDVLKFTDKEQIELSLNHTGWGWNSNKDYVAVFYYEIGDYSEVLFFDEEHAPDFIKAHFK